MVHFRTPETKVFFARVYESISNAVCLVKAEGLHR